MKKFSGDVDIDLYNRDELLSKIRHVSAASIKDDNTYTKHTVGIYVQDIPFDPKDGTANIDYKLAPEIGFFKLDLLNVSAYENIKNEKHLQTLVNTEPNWEYLENKTIVDSLFHVNNYIDLLRETKPKSVEQLAAVIAMIRPAKKYLIGESWDKVMQEIWKKPEDGSFYFKKAHAISYALVIVCQLNLISERLVDSSN